MLLSTASTRILLNGDPGRPIDAARGLRQGDPLSPMIFILAMDVLHRLMTHAANQNLLQPIGHRSISHQCSLYADDVILFISPIDQDLAVTTGILDIFGMAMGLRTNMAKCTITPIACSEEDITRTQSYLPYQLEGFPITYLGIPLTTNRLRKGELEPLVDKVRRRIPMWKAKIMNKTGCLELVKSTMSVIPIYTMVVIKMPAWAINAIAKYRRGFFWAGETSAPGGKCTLSWQCITRPSEVGGLGIPDLRTMGAALHLRWQWLKRTDDTRPWSKL